MLLLVVFLATTAYCRQTLLELSQMPTLPASARQSLSRVQAAPGAVLPLKVCAHGTRFLIQSVCESTQEVEAAFLAAAQASAYAGLYTVFPAVTPSREESQKSFAS